MGLFLAEKQAKARACQNQARLLPELDRAPARVRQERCLTLARLIYLLSLAPKATRESPLTKLLMPIEKVGDEKPLPGEGVACAF
jgi:hypothetical protein